VQDAFAEALRKRATFRGEGALEAWIWRIALRLALVRCGSETLLPFVEIEEAALPDAGLDPELAAALARLPPRQRLIVFLRYFGDLTYAEIAAICGISEGTVAAALAQARNELKMTLEHRGASA
jgi:RNA polymerase sigma factor (sigma-70 family)